LGEVLDAAPDDVIGPPPAVGFAAVMGGFALILNLWGIWKLRVWNPSGEPVQQRERKEDEDETKDRVRAHAAPGRVRDVRGNPIMWREVFTRAYGRRSFLVKLSYFLAIALVGYYALAPLLFESGGRTPFIAAYGIVPIVILSLLLIAAQSVTAITSERDTG